MIATPASAPRIVSVVWSDSSRVAQNLARRLGAEFHLLPCPRKPPLARAALYRRLARETAEILARERPDAVIVQNPPIHAVSAVARYARKNDEHYVIDAHSGAFLGRGALQSAYRRRFARLAHNALVTLIHNEDLIPCAEDLEIRYLHLEMAVPERPTEETAELRHPAIVAVCGYGRDEPLAELLKAASILPEVNFYLTGKYPGRRRLPSNVTATGFLPELDYWRLLNGSDAVMALTTREATILSGAYEGLSAGKPLILSRTDTLSRTFRQGAVLVEDDVESIANGIKEIVRRGRELAAQVVGLREEKTRRWEQQFRKLQYVIKSR